MSLESNDPPNDLLQLPSEQWAALLELAPMGIYVVDAGLRIVLANSIVCATFGPDFLGHDLRDVVRRNWPAAYGAELIGRFLHTLATGRSYRHAEHSEERVDLRRTEHYEWEIHRVALKGGHGVVCYGRDVSARVNNDRELARQREALRAGKERLELAQCTSGIGMFDWDIINDTSEVSPEWLRIYGLTDAEPVLTHENWRERVHPDDREQATAVALAALHSAEPYQHEFRVVWPDGSVHWVKSAGKTLFDGAGRPCRLLGTAMDVSELVNAKLAAEAASKAKDDFLSVLSHELRTPLAPVLATAELLEMDDLIPGDQRRSMARLIRRNVELEARLIDDLLDVTRIANNKIELQFAAVDVHETIVRVLEICRGDALDKDIVVDSQLRATERFVRADATRLQQVIWNLLKNAIKFTRPAGRVTLCTQNPERGLVAVEIGDTGIGIEPHQLPHIFNAFEQGSRTITQKFGGLGLGLAITKALVHLHGGIIDVASGGADLGATFTVKLPTTAAAAAVAEAPPPETSSQLDCHVLLVEDHVDTRQIMEYVLRDLGCRVEAVGTAADALCLAESHAFGLVISDIGLPDSSGTTLMRELKSRYSIKGIALSGYGRDQDLRESGEAGFDVHLVKPVSCETLAAAIHRLTDQAVRS